jgi:hypothetical protein
MSEKRDLLVHEKRISERTQAENPTEVGLCERFLNHLGDGFNRIERPLAWEERKGTILLLATMGYNSLRWAWELLLKGYYTQANALSRTGWECWLNAAYLLLYPEQLESWRDFASRPRPKKMRRLVARRWAELGLGEADEFQTAMDRWYSDYSEYVHPSDGALKALVAQRNSGWWLSLGGEYDADLMVESTQMFCYAAMILSPLLYSFLPDTGEYRERAHELTREVAAWRRMLVRRYAGTS